MLLPQETDYIVIHKPSPLLIIMAGTAKEPFGAATSPQFHRGFVVGTKPPGKVISPPYPLFNSPLMGFASATPILSEAAISVQFYHRPIET